ncbi:MAG: ATP-binding protein, partial [Aeromicrobium sp.]
MRRTSWTSRLTLRTQAVVALVLLLLTVVILSMAASSAVLRNDLKKQYEQRALAIAHSVAQPDLARLVVSTKPTVSGPVESAAEKVRRSTKALYVVVTDDRGIRYSHPNRALIGHLVSTSPDAALQGKDVVTIEKGTLGYSARGKVPLRTSNGAIVGEVSVGIDIAELNAETRKLVFLLGLVAVVPFVVGLLGAVTLARRLRRTTLGLEPEEMADLLREHAAVLGGVRDGIIAIDNSGLVMVTNPQAAQLLGRQVLRGEPIAKSGAGSEIVELFEQMPPPVGVLRVIGAKVLLATRLPVQRDDRDLGQVLILRDRSDLDQLGRELEATRALTDALRAQAHENTNRLHVLTGLLHNGHVKEAQAYLVELGESTTWVEGVDDAYLAGLLAAKAAAASEAGVRLIIDDSSWVDGRLTRPLDTVTVVANLLDNGIRAASDGDRRPAWVEVTLLSDGSDLVVHVVDSGRGVPPEMNDAVFDHGFTTRESGVPGHGLGLALALHTARAHGGDVTLRDGGGDAHGAVFEARLVGVLSHQVDTLFEGV